MKLKTAYNYMTIKSERFKQELENMNLKILKPHPHAKQEKQCKSTPHPLSSETL